MRTALSLAALLLACSLAAAPSYPLHGTVVSIRQIDRDTSVTETYTGQVTTLHSKDWIYRLETADHFYELRSTKEAEFAVGDALDFRVQHNRVFVKAAPGKKERKFDSVGEGAKPAKKSP